MSHATKIGKKTGKKMGQWIVFVFALLSVLVSVSMSTARAAAGGIEVTATVDRNALNPDDSLTLSISVTSDDEVTAGAPTLPNLADFEIVNEWTSQEARASFVSTPNGPQFKTVRTSRFNYMLRPKRQGTLNIGAAEVIVDGKSFFTKPISIKVAPGAGLQARPPGRRPSPPTGVFPPPGFFDDEEDDLFAQLLRRGQPGGGQDGSDGIGSRTLPVNPQDAFFIQVEADKTEAYVGEQVTVSWYLYTRGQIRDLDTLKYPSLKGFWKEDIEIATHLNFTQEVVNGVPYKKALLASFALFPIKEGTAVIDSYTAKCSVIPVVDSFGGAFSYGKAYTFTKSSQPLKVTVKPLPVEGRPADFSGAVGDFQVSARVEDNNPIADQPFSYKIRFEGRGNAKTIDLPPFEPPQGLEIYDTQKDAKFFRTGTSYKDFNILLIPRSEGEFTIPSLSVSIFDPEQKRYVTKATDPVQVRVGRGHGTPADSSRNFSLGGKGDKGEEKKEDPVPRLEVEWRPGGGGGMSGLWRSLAANNAAVQGGLFVAVLLTLFWRARIELGWGQRKKDLMRRLKARLRRVNEKVEKGDWRGVGLEMTNTVYFVLGEVCGEGGANVELDKLLLKAPPSVRREIGGPVTKLMETFQVLTFAPEAVVGSLKEPARLKRAVSEMEKLMETAVALGLSSGQADESGSGPKAS